MHSAATASQRNQNIGAFVVPSGGNRLGGPLYVAGGEISIKIASRDTGGAFAVFEGSVDPQVGPPLHRHREQDEWWYIIEGQFLFEVDGKQVHAGVGDVVFAPKGSCHTFQNIGSTPARAITTVVPGGLDVFFQELSAAVPRGVAIEPEKVVSLFEKHGLELLGPPLAAR